MNPSVPDTLRYELIHEGTVRANGVIADLTDLPPKHIVSADELKSRVVCTCARGKPTVLLLRTGYDRYAGTEEWFNHPVLGSDACKYVVEAGFKVLGTDAPALTGNPTQHTRFSSRQVS